MKILQAKSFIQKLKIYFLYQSSFPRYERKPFSIILDMQKKGKTDVWYIEEDKKFVALATTINGDDLILLDYFAVSKNLRGKGLGTKILKTLRNLYPDRGFFLEIEFPHSNAQNYSERIRRKNFYLSCGMSEQNVRVKLFGVDMELLGYDCNLTFESYREFDRKNYTEKVSENVKPR